MIDTQFLAGLERFNLIVRKRVTSNYSGPRRSIAQGRGIVFKDHRIYTPGDDFRAIDWKVYARTDDLMVKNYEEEKNLVVHIIVDKSASMNFGKLSKFDYASMLGVGYAFLAMKGNDKFQFATFAEDIDVYQPKRGVSQLISMVDYLNSRKLKGKTNFVEMAQKYKNLLWSKSLIIIISDFLAPIGELKEALYYFAGHEVKLIQVLDYTERNPDLEGDFKMKDSESSKEMRMFFSLKSREDYLQRLEYHNAHIEEICLGLGIDFFKVSTEIPIFDTFYTILR